MMHAGTHLLSSRIVAPFKLRASHFLARTKVSRHPIGFHVPQRHISASATRAAPQVKRVISTLRRENLTFRDHLDVSNFARVAIRIPEHVAAAGASALGLSNRSHARMEYGFFKDTRYLSFPADTRGFLYYFLPPSAPPLAGQVRFRVTPSADPQSFAAGHDLPHPHTTLPAAWPLRRLATSPPLRPLLDLLLHDGLVSRALAAEAAASAPTRGARGLYALGQPFYLDLQTFKAGFDVMADVDGRSVVERAAVVFAVDRARRAPYTGAVVCCFVRTAPEVISIRVLKVIKDITAAYPQPDVGPDFKRPQEGELLPVRRGLWSYRVRDEETQKAKSYVDRTWPLRLLKECPGVTWDQF